MPLINEIGNWANKTKSSAQKIAEVSKIQKRVGSMAREIEKVYLQIGKMYYAQLSGGNFSQDAIDQLCITVRTLERDIQTLNGRIDELRDIVRCPQCAKSQAKGSSFCAACGSKIPASDVRPQVEEHLICPQCFAKIDSESAFCTACGHQLTKPVTADETDVDAPEADETEL